MNNPNSFIEKILKYENSIFNEYTIKRNTLIENIKNLQLNDLNKDQLLNLTSDIKLVIDPIKTSISNMDDYFNNLKNSWNSNESTKTLNELNLFYTFFFLFTGSGSGSEDPEISESDSVFIPMSKSGLD